MKVNSARCFILLSLPLALSGCILGYPLQVAVGSAGVVATARKQAPDCLRSIHVFERPASKRQAQIGPDAPPIWTLEAVEGRCVTGFPTLRYGQVPDGMVETAPAPALIPGRTYWLRGYTPGALYSGEFIAPGPAPGS